MPPADHPNRPLHYRGGKMLLAGWINQHLPPARAYIEPFAGMASVLLAREPVSMEVLNDADQRIYQWWQVVRDQPEELAQYLACTPYAQQAHTEAAQAAVGAGTPVEQAAVTCVLLEQGLQASLDGANSWRYPRYRGFNGTIWASLPGRVQPLAKRLAHVTLACEDGVDVLARYAAQPGTLIYCDPPYPGTSGYQATLDAADFMGALLAPEVQAQVAVSGFADSWPALSEAGWHTTTLRREANSPVGAAQHCTECLWTNYQPEPAQGRLL